MSNRQFDKFQDIQGKLSPVFETRLSPSAKNKIREALVRFGETAEVSRPTLWPSKRHYSTALKSTAAAVAGVVIVSMGLYAHSNHAVSLDTSLGGNKTLTQGLSNKAREAQLHALLTHVPTKEARRLDSLLKQYPTQVLLPTKLPFEVTYVNASRHSISSMDLMDITFSSLKTGQSFIEEIIFPSTNLSLGANFNSNNPTIRQSKIKVTSTVLQNGTKAQLWTSSNLGNSMRWIEEGSYYSVGSGSWQGPQGKTQQFTATQIESMVNAMK